MCDSRLSELSVVFQKLTDPRDPRGVRFPFSALCALVFLGLLARICEMAVLIRWAEAHWEQLRLAESEKKRPATSLSVSNVPKLPVPPAFPDLSPNFPSPNFDKPLPHGSHRFSKKVNLPFFPPPLMAKPVVRQKRRSGNSSQCFSSRCQARHFTISRRSIENQ